MYVETGMAPVWIHSDEPIIERNPAKNPTTLAVLRFDQDYDEYRASMVDFESISPLFTHSQ